MVEQMKRIKVLFLAALLTVGMMGIAPRVEAANWVWVTSTDYATVRIDASTCRWINGTLSFWNSCYYIDSAGRNKEIRRLQNAAYKNGENVDYSNLRKVISHLVMYQAKDGTLYYKTLHITWYDSKGYVIDSADWSSDNFKVLPPDSIGEAEYHVAKRYAR